MSEVKVNKISPRTNCGTVTLGDSGDSFVIPAGATIVNNGTQTGFGRTGTVDWDTTAKTASFTAVSGNGYFVNTTSGAITVTLPAGSAGDIISLADYAATWQTNAVTVTPNGTDKIGGINSPTSLGTEGQSVTFVYADSTQGWLNTMDSTSNVRASAFITATGGTITTCGNCKIHTFTSPGTFCVSSAAICSANNEVSYIVVGGGASGGTGCTSNSTELGGGGGAGGFRENKSPVTPYTASPLNGASPITVTATSFPITVGGGGASNPSGASNGSAGSNSVFSTITSTGGGGGGGTQNGLNGGSGGGGGALLSTTRCGGSGNTPPVSPAQGNNGGSGSHAPGSAKAGGGGGAGCAGNNGTGGPGTALSDYGFGGAGVTTSITGASVAYSGGGAGATNNGTPFGPGGDASIAGGTGGGGCGAYSPGGLATAGTANTGGGGGGGGSHCVGPNIVGGSGGSGIVVIRYKYQ